VPRDRLARFVALSALLHAGLAAGWSDLRTERALPPPNEAPVRVQLLAPEPAPEPVPEPIPQAAPPQPVPVVQEPPPEPPPEAEPEPEPEPEPKEVARVEPPAPEPRETPPEPEPTPAPAAAPAPPVDAEPVAPPLPPVAAAPLPAAEPGAPATPPTPTPEEIEAYIAKVRAWIDRHKTYPGMARRRGIEADVTIRLDIAPDGAVRELSTSGDAPGMFRSATEDAVARAAPFPEPPAGFGTLEIGIRYQMER